MTIYEPCHKYDLWTHPPPDLIDWLIRKGVEIRKESKERGDQNKNNYAPTEDMAKRIQSLGALAEGAVAYGLGYPVELIHQLVRSGTYNVPDLLDDIQVRLIGVNHYGLRVYPQHDGKGDEPHWKVVGVVIERGDERKPPWRIPGWIYARDARRKEWLIDPHDRKAPMWAVPQEFLRDPMELSKKRRPLIPPKPKYNPTLQPPPKPVAPPRAKFQLRGVKVSSEARCPVCYQVGGKFERVTYTDAPLGGLPVHTDCIVDFFTHMIDGQGGLI